MSFPPGFLDELRTRLPLSEVVGRRLRLIRAGREMKAPCPFHGEKTPSFYVNDQKGFFHCFGCGAHGDVIGFVMRHDNLSFPDAVEQLAGLAGMDVPKPSEADRQRYDRERRLFDLVEAAARWFEGRLRSRAGKVGLDYLLRRGLDDQAMARFRLGFAPSDGGALRVHLAEAGFQLDDMVEVGLLRRPDDGREPYAFFRNRVIFPVADKRGRVVAFGGRIIEGDGPKYVNSPDSPLFHKGELLYGLSHARQAAADGKPVIVAEGYMDVIALASAGFTGAVAPLGTALTEAQILALWRLIPDGERVPVLCFDGDGAGRRAAARAVARALPLLKPDHSARVAFLPDGEDPDSLIRSGGGRAMQAVLDAARPLADMVWEITGEGRDLSAPEARAGFKAALEQAVRQIADRDVQQFYRADMARRLEEAFGPPRRAGAAAPGGAGWGDRAAWAGPRGRFRREPPAPVVDRRRPAGGAEMSERVLLALLIEHPCLFDAVGEALGGAAFAGAANDAMRQALIDALSRDPHLDSADLRRHLTATGFARQLAELADRAVELHVRPARGADALDRARRIWADAWTRLGRRTMEAERMRAGQVLARDPCQANVDRLGALLAEAGSDPADGEETAGE